MSISNKDRETNKHTPWFSVDICNIVSSYRYFSLTCGTPISVQLIIIGLYLWQDGILSREMTSSSYQSN